MKLYVWTNVLWHHGSGVVYALAESSAQAYELAVAALMREMVLDKREQAEDELGNGNLTVYDAPHCGLMEGSS